MTHSQRLLSSLSLLVLSAAFLGGQGCSSDDATGSGNTEAGAGGEATNGGAPGTAGKGTTNGGMAGKGTAGGTGGTTTPIAGGAGTSGGDAGAGGVSVSDAGAGGISDAGGAGGAAGALAVIATIPAQGGDVPLTLPGGQVVTFTFPASAAGKQVTLTPTDATSIGWPAGQFSDVITMEPDGLTFADPVVIRLASKSLIVLDFSSSGQKGPGQGLALNAAKDGLLLKHFSTLAVVPSGKTCDSTSGWNATPDAAACAAFAPATTSMDFGCKGYNFCQLIQAHCCAMPGATDCQLGDANASVSYTDSDGNGTYAYCKPSLSLLAPTSGAVGASVVATGTGWDTYYAVDPGTHFVSNVVFYNQQGIPTYAQGDPQTVLTQDTVNRNSVTFTVPTIAAGNYNVGVTFRNGIGSTTMPFTITQ
jgi:IPT/TIG domain